MTRIGIDARLAYYRYGGIASYILHLVNELPQIDPSNEYLILHQRKDRRNLAQAANQKRIRCWTPSHHRFERLAMTVEMLPLGLDILHTTDFIPPVNGRYKSVITVHDLTFLHYPEFTTAESRRYYNGQIEAAVARADHIMTDSEATRDDVIRILNIPPEKITTVLLGVSEHFQPAQKTDIKKFLSETGLEPGYILFVGTFEPRKNLPGLLNSYKKILERLSDPPFLVLAGQRGWLYDNIFETVQKLGLETHVRWLEKVDYHDLPALYSAAGVLCLPSFYEGFGFPPLEAMACGTPVVVSNRSSLPEIVGDAGMLIDPDDVKSITDGIMQVLADRDLARDLKKRGLEHVKQFTWHKTAHQVRRVYQKVLNNE